MAARDSWIFDFPSANFFLRYSNSLVFRKQLVRMLYLMFMPQNPKVFFSLRGKAKRIANCVDITRKWLLNKNLNVMQFSRRLFLPKQIACNTKIFRLGKSISRYLVENPFDWNNDFNLWGSRKETKLANFFSRVVALEGELGVR